MSGEWLDMPLNCRESLVLSTGPVHLQVKRPWDVADDDVGGVAVVKYEAGEATCEGLILSKWSELCICYKAYCMTQTIEQLKILFPNICHVMYKQFYMPITAVGDNCNPRTRHTWWFSLIAATGI